MREPGLAFVGIRFRLRRIALVGSVAAFHGGILLAWIPQGEGRAPFAPSEIIVTTEVVDAPSEMPSDGTPPPATEAREEPIVEPETIPSVTPEPVREPPSPPQAADEHEPPPVATTEETIAAPPPKPAPVVERPRRKAEPRREKTAVAAPSERRALADRPAATGAIAGRAAAGATTARAGADPGYGTRVRAVLQARIDGLGLEDVEGSVVVAFTIDASGAVASHGLARPSGSGQIDRAVSGLLGRMRFPPPPAGRFAATVVIRIR